MNRKRQLQESRDSWKSKTVEARAKVRQLSKDKRRLAKERDRYKAMARKASRELEEERKRASGISTVKTKEDLIYLTLKLFRDASLGFRAVSRVLSVLSDVLGLDVHACAQTVINWVARLAIVRVHCYAAPVCVSRLAPFSNGNIWLIDISIALSSAKILTIIAINIRHYEDHDKAPTLLDYQCVAVAVAESWNGQSEADFMERVIAVTGRPAALLMDGGTDLGKSVRDLAAKGIQIPVIEDVSHVVANLLKHEYEGHSSFKPFMTACGQASKRLKQTILAFLAPPKVSMKGRFMNLHRLVRWAAQILQHSPRGRAANGSHLQKLRNALDRLPEHKPFINNFLRDSMPLLDCMKLVKRKGLSHETWAQCQQLIESIPAKSPVRKGFIDWGDRMVALAKQFGVGDTSMPASTDGLESLFSIGKRHGTGEIQDANRIAARLPVECGPITREDAQRVLQVSVREQEAVMGNLPSLLRQRCSILSNPGSLQDTPLDPGKHLELIPQAKTREKIPNATDISVRCAKGICPPEDSRKNEKGATSTSSMVG